METLAIPYSRYIFGTLPWYSVTMVTGIIAALLWASHEEKRFGMPKDTIVDLSLWLIPCGIVGARLYYVAFAWDTFAADPISVLYIWKGGLAIYGALIGGAAAAWVFSRRRKLSMLTLLDMIAPGLVLAQAIGRWGNYFNMEAYGLPLTQPALQFFPMGVLINEGGAQVWHMATFFYESLWDFLAFIALACLRKRLTRSGDVFLLYACLYGAGRLLVEGLRMDSLMSASGAVRVSQLLSVAACIVVLAVFAWRGLRGAHRGVIIAGGVGAAVGAVAGLLVSGGSEAFFGYRAAFCIKCAVLLGGITAAAFSVRRVSPARMLLSLPCLLTLFGEGYTLCALTHSTLNDDVRSLILCAWFTATLVTALFALLPFSMRASRPDAVLDAPCAKEQHS